MENHGRRIASVGDDIKKAMAMDIAARGREGTADEESAGEESVGEETARARLRPLGTRSSP